MSKKLTQDDLLRELGELLSIDLVAKQADLRHEQTVETTQMTKRHQQERRALEDQKSAVDRRTVELREAIRLVREEQMDPMLALMHTKGTAEFVMIGSEMVWTIKPKD